MVLNSPGAECEQKILPCDSNPCYGRGTCEDVDDDFVCHCSQGKLTVVLWKVLSENFIV